MLAGTVTFTQANATVRKCEFHHCVTSMQSTPKSVLFDEAWYQNNTRPYYDIHKGLSEKNNAIWLLQSTEVGLDTVLIISGAVARCSFILRTLVCRLLHLETSKRVWQIWHIGNLVGNEALRYYAAVTLDFSFH